MTGDVMEFPETFEEFAKAYSIVDRKEVYTNGSKLIPVFRVKQWLENTALRQKMVDRDALLALADKARKLGDEENGPASFAVRCTFRVFARNIYKALGMSGDE